MPSSSLPPRLLGLLVFISAVQVTHGAPVHNPFQVAGPSAVSMPLEYDCSDSDDSALPPIDVGKIALDSPLVFTGPPKALSSAKSTLTKAVRPTPTVDFEMPETKKPKGTPPSTKKPDKPGHAASSAPAPAGGKGPSSTPGMPVKPTVKPGSPKMPPEGDKPRPRPTPVPDKPVFTIPSGPKATGVVVGSLVPDAPLKSGLGPGAPSNGPKATKSIGIGGEIIPDTPRNTIAPLNSGVPASTGAESPAKTVEVGGQVVPNTPKGTLAPIAPGGPAPKDDNTVPKTIGVGGGIIPDAPKGTMAPIAPGVPAPKGGSPAASAKTPGSLVPDAPLNSPISSPPTATGKGGSSKDGAIPLGFPLVPDSPLESGLAPRPTIVVSGGTAAAGPERLTPDSNLVPDSPLKGSGPKAPLKQNVGEKGGAPMDEGHSCK